MDKQIEYIVGIDEVGRGPIAGPVAVCAFLCVEREIEKIVQEANLPIRDSKKLTEKQREKWYKYLRQCQKEGKCDFSVNYVTAENIDKFGISKCIQKALDKSLDKVATQASANFSRFTPEGPYATKNSHQPATSKKQNYENFLSRRGRAGASEDERRGISEENFYSSAKLEIFLDGGLKAPKEYVNQQTVIKGDELHPIISLASIVAKVSRDRVMQNFSKEYPEYGFENHAGYGTKAHYEAIKKHGLTPLHRKTFIN